VSANRAPKGPIQVTSAAALRSALVAGYADDELAGTSQFPLDSSLIGAARENLAAEGFRFRDESPSAGSVTTAAREPRSTSTAPQPTDDEALRREFASSPSLQDEFGTFEYFLGYRRAMSRGLVRMIGGHSDV